MVGTGLESPSPSAVQVSGGTWTPAAASGSTPVPVSGPAPSGSIFTTEVYDPWSWWKGRPWSEYTEAEQAYAAEYTGWSVPFAEAEDWYTFSRNREVVELGIPLWAASAVTGIGAAGLIGKAAGLARSAFSVALGSGKVVQQGIKIPGILRFLFGQTGKTAVSTAKVMTGAGGPRDWLRVAGALGGTGAVAKGAGFVAEEMVGAIDVLQGLTGSGGSPSGFAQDMPIPTYIPMGTGTFSGR